MVDMFSKNMMKAIVELVTVVVAGLGCLVVTVVYFKKKPETVVGILSSCIVTMTGV